MDTVRCPFCRRSWPAGTATCPKDATLLVDPGVSGLPFNAPLSTTPTDGSDETSAGGTDSGARASAPPAPPEPGSTLTPQWCPTCHLPMTTRPCATCYPGQGTFHLHLPGGVRLPLPEGAPVVLGRESSAPQVASALAPFDIVSRQHARLTLTARRLRIEDLHSTNGTFVDGRGLGSAPVERDLPVRLRLGSSVHLEVR